MCFRIFGEASYFIEPLLGQMIADQFRHFEHTDARFAENFFQRSISVDLTFVAWILEIFGLDVVPKFLCNFGPWQGLCTNNSRKRSTWRHRLHEPSVGAWLWSSF